MSQHHDPVHPDAGHLTAETLADFDLGLLDAESAEHATTHLEHCATCAQLHDDLAALTDALGGLADHPAEPMPDEVWNRVSDALAAEPVTTLEGSATVVPMDVGGRRKLWRPGIGVAAAIAFIALVGGIVFPKLMDDSSTTASSSADGTGTSEEARTPTTADFQATRSGTQYKQEDLDQQVSQLVTARQKMFDSSAQSVLGSTADTATSSPSASPSGDAPATPTPPRQTPASGQLSSSARELLRTAGPMATSPAAAQACLASYLDVTGVAPLAVDIGLWQGKPAAVIVLPLEDPTLAQVWVIDPACNTASGQDPLYYYATVRR
ncbi:MAG: hypothetical protein ACJ73L_03255 [Actinomycetes bacterium]